MEENIERWHTEKQEKYSKRTVLYCIFEVGCRGFLPSRFFSITRSLGFTSSEAAKLRNNLQLIARKCSYIIWINRFNKDFEAPRITGDPPDSPVPCRSSSRNMFSASVPTVAAHPAVLEAKVPSFHQADLQAQSSLSEAKVQRSSQSPLSFPLPLVLSEHTVPIHWSILDFPGVALKNTLNKCWYHACMHFLSAIPALRILCLSSSWASNSFFSILVMLFKAFSILVIPPLWLSFFGQ